MRICFPGEMWVNICTRSSCKINRRLFQDEREVVIIAHVRPGKNQIRLLDEHTEVDPGKLIERTHYLLTWQDWVGSGLGKHLGDDLLF